MDRTRLEFSDDFIVASKKLHDLCDALDLLKEARIKYVCSIDFCFKLMSHGAAGDETSVHALNYSVRLAARQARLSIAARPKWAKCLEDIRLGRSRVKSMKVLTYQALLPFALKQFE